MCGGFVYITTQSLRSCVRVCMGERAMVKKKHCFSGAGTHLQTLNTFLLLFPPLHLCKPPWPVGAFLLKKAMELNGLQQISLSQMFVFVKSSTDNLEQQGQGVMLDSNSPQSWSKADASKHFMPGRHHMGLKVLEHVLSTVLWTAVRLFCHYWI